MGHPYVILTHLTNESESLILLFKEGHPGVFGLIKELFRSSLYFVIYIENTNENCKIIKKYNICYK